MKKLFITLTTITVLLSSIPYLAQLFSHPHVGVGMIASAWLILYPIYFLVLGITLSKYYKKISAWMIPICYIVYMFITNCLISSTDIWIYFAGYILVSYGSMSVTALTYHLKEKRLDK